MVPWGGTCKMVRARGWLRDSDEKERDGGKEGCGMAAKWAMRWGCTTGRRGGYVQTRARVQEGSKQTLERVFTKMPKKFKKKKPTK